jgi:hypothetical protein
MEGLISRSCTGYIKNQVKVYLQTPLLMQWFIFEKVFANNSYNPSNSVVLGTIGLPVRCSPGTQPHTFPENNSRHGRISNPNTSFLTTL